LVHVSLPLSIKAFKSSASKTFKSNRCPSFYRYLRSTTNSEILVQHETFPWRRKHPKGKFSSGNGSSSEYGIKESSLKGAGCDFIVLL
jgi:hypothetical protein